MRKHFYHQKNFLAGMLLFPLLASAQQRSPSSVAMPLPMMAPARPMVMPAAAAATRPMIHSVPAQSAHPVAHPASPSARPVSPKSSGHPISTIAPARSHTVHHNGGVTIGPVAPRAAFVDDGYPTPGLGFDYVHYAAVHPDQRQRHSFEGGVFPFVGGGIYIPSAGYLEGAVPQEPAEESQSAEAAETAVDSPDAVATEQAPVSVHARPTPNPPSAASPEYIFVRRDGTVFFAVAYSWLNGNLQYVTHDGLRKLASLSTLDLDATTQFNEQRGLAFRSPA
jgi:hypothetical protein